MATATLYFASLASGTVSGASNALGSTAATWTTDALNASTSWTSVWTLDAPPANSVANAGAGNQTVSATVRKGSNSGNPGWRLGISQAGTELAFASGTVTSTTGQTISFAFNGNLITDTTTLTITLDITAAGGSPSARNTAQVDFGSLVLNYTQIVTTTPATVAAAATVGSGGPLGGVTLLKPTSLTGSVYGTGAINDAGDTIVIPHGGTSVSVWTASGGWTTKAVGGGVNNVAYGNGYWVVVNGAGANYCAYATDPLGTWTSFDPWGGTPPVTGEVTAAYGNGWWLICSISATAGSVYINGNPSGAWTRSTTLFGGSNPGINHVHYLGGVWIVGTNAGAANYYNTGNPNTGWATTDAGSTTKQWEAVAYNGTHYVAVGTDGTDHTWYTTTVGSGAWTTATEPGGWDDSASVGAVMYDYRLGLWHVAGSNAGGVTSQVMTASDPSSTWTRTADAWPSTTTIPGGALFTSPNGSAYGMTGGYIVWNKNTIVVNILTPRAPSTVAAAVTVGSPTVTTGGGAALATPSVVAVVATVGSPTFTSAATPTPAVVAAAATVGSPSIPVVVSVAGVAATATVASPAIPVVVPAATVSATATVGAAQVTPAQTGTVAGTVTVGGPSVLTSSTVAVSTAAAVATVGAPTVVIATNATATPGTVAASATVPLPEYVQVYTRPYGITTTTLTFS